jgi:uncharacterized membrane protein SpoIIM required for sporulation
VSLLIVYVVTFLGLFIASTIYYCSLVILPPSFMEVYASSISVFDFKANSISSIRSTNTGSSINSIFDEAEYHSMMIVLSIVMLQGSPGIRVGLMVIEFILSFL